MTPPPRARVAARVAFGLWTLTMAVAFLLPGQVVEQTPLFSPDKFIHVGVFGLWGVLALAAGLPVRSMALWGLAYGLLSEGAQTALPALQRSGNAADLLADAAGLAGAAALAWVWQRGRGNRRSPDRDPGHPASRPAGREVLAAVEPVDAG